MEDKLLISALSQVCEEGLLSRDDTQLPKGFKFSKDFEAKMREITGREKRIYVRKRLKLAFFAAAVFAVGFLLGMARQPEWSYVSREADSGMYLTFDISSVKAPKNTIEERYTLSGIPEGLQLYDSINTEYSSIYSWGTYDQKGNEIIDIVFMQYTPAGYRDVYIADNDRKYLVTEDNGIQYYILEAGTDMNSVIWYQDGYVFVADAKMNKSDMIKLCKTLKIEE